MGLVCGKAREQSPQAVEKPSGHRSQKTNRKGSLERDVSSVSVVSAMGSIRAGSGSDRGSSDARQVARGRCGNARISCTFVNVRRVLYASVCASFPPFAEQVGYTVLSLPGFSACTTGRVAVEGTEGGRPAGSVLRRANAPLIL